MYFLTGRSANISVHVAWFKKNADQWIWAWCRKRNILRIIFSPCFSFESNKLLIKCSVFTARHDFQIHDLEERLSSLYLTHWNPWNAWALLARKVIFWNTSSSSLALDVWYDVPVAIMTNILKGENSKMISLKLITIQKGLIHDQDPVFFCEFVLGNSSQNWLFPTKFVGFLCEISFFCTISCRIFNFVLSNS